MAWMVDGSPSDDGRALPGACAGSAHRFVQRSPSTGGDARFQSRRPIIGAFEGHAAWLPVSASLHSFHLLRHTPLALISKQTLLPMQSESEFIQQIAAINTGPLPQSMVTSAIFTFTVMQS